MHTWTIRLYSLFGFAVTATMCLLVAMHLTSYYYSLQSRQTIYGVSIAQPIAKGAKKAYNSIEKLATLPAHDEMSMNITLGYDFSGLFNWNTKQVYASVIAIYNDTSGLQKQTVWDKVVTRAHRKIYNGTVVGTYPLHSYNLQGSLADVKKIDLEFYIQVMPYAGLLRTRRYAFTDVPMVKGKR